MHLRAVLQDFRDGRCGALMDAASVLSPVAGGGSSELALAPNLTLETRELWSCEPLSSGSRPMISSTTRLLPD